MQITANTTPFLAELFVSTDKFGRKRCVVVIKATYDVGPDGECFTSPEQESFVYTDEHYGDPGTTAIRRESDFAPVKPRPEVLLNAAAFAPEGRAVQALEVRLVGPGLNKRAMITGDRFWVRSFSSFAPSEPLPFVTMPLVWDRAFGGSDLSNVEGPSRNGSEMRNLVGVGFHLNSDDSAVLGAPLPNLERIDEPVRSWSDKPQPIGFGPVGRGWRPRIGFAGTYDQRWMDETLPFLPVDFDERYFQSAPTDQQLTTLSGGTTFGCVHMSPRGRFVARLPSLRVPLRFLFSDRIESRMVTADTLILEPSDARLILLGRASVALPRQFTALREIRVGLPPRPTGDKPRFRGLGEAVAALRRVH